MMENKFEWIDSLLLRRKPGKPLPIKIRHDGLLFVCGDHTAGAQIAAAVIGIAGLVETDAA